MNPSFAVHRMNFLMVFSLAVTSDKVFATALEINLCNFAGLCIIPRVK